MRKSVKKFAVLIVALIMALAILVGCGGNYTSSALYGYISSQTKAVSNGGFVVEKDNWIYFINGSEEYTAENKFGNVQKGALMRISQIDLDAGNYDRTDVVVPLLMVSQDYTSGIYVYGDYVYYATPTSTKNTDGVVENSWLDFKRSKLDGSETMRDYYFRVSNNATVFRFVEIENVVYCLYVDSTEKEIHSYNTETKTDTVLVKGFESYVLDAVDVTNPTVYYTMPVEKKIGYRKGSTNSESYKQVYTVRADATECPYEIDLATDYTDKDSGEVMEYTNLGKLIFDGIGAKDQKTVFNHFGNENAPTVGYTYTLVKYENNGLYYTRTDTAGGSSAGDGGALYYIADADLAASDWNAVTANASDKNVQLAANTTSASATSLFYIENNAHYYMYVQDGKIVRVKVGTAQQAYRAEETILSYNATGATLLFTEGNYLYYSTSGTNGSSLNRIRYNGAKDDYNGMLAADLIESVKYLDIDYKNSWYKPEAVAGHLFFANAATYGYGYTYVMKNHDDNAEIEAMNDKLEQVNKVFTEIGKKFSDVTNAAKFYFYTADKTKIREEKHVGEYKEDALAVFEQFTDLKAGAYGTDQLKDKSGKAYNVESYFYNRIGTINKADTEARDEALEKLLLSEEEEEKTGWQTWQYVALWVPVGAVILAGAVVAAIFLLRKKR